MSLYSLPPKAASKLCKSRKRLLIKLKDLHITVETTARDQLQSYPTGTLQEDDGILFCSTYNVALDHTRKSSVDKHLRSATHIYLLDSQFFSETNNKTVSQAVLRTINKINIDFDNLRLFNSNNVSYIKKALKPCCLILFHWLFSSHATVTLLILLPRTLTKALSSSMSS